MTPGTCGNAPFTRPVSGRFKIYIIDEAHMVTREGFNALLKLVEEPPPHLKFVFATTEPEKVIATIRSRTHHYPFRLVPPAVLREHLEQILASEGVPYEPAVLPIVIRAGAGSVRDALSVLDQLMAGSDESGLRYDRAIALLGYTDDRLLDEVVEAFAADDGAAVFHAIDHVVEAGHDPRRFAADLLDRLRDLIVISAVPDAAATGLIDAPAGPGRRKWRKQAAALRPGRTDQGGRDHQRRAGRDARRYLAPAAARADVRPGAAAGRLAPTRPGSPTGWTGWSAGLAPAAAGGRTGRQPASGSPPQAAGPSRSARRRWSRASRHRAARHAARRHSGRHRHAAAAAASRPRRPAATASRLAAAPNGRCRTWHGRTGHARPALGRQRSQAASAAGAAAPARGLASPGRHARAARPVARRAGGGPGPQARRLDAAQQRQRRVVRRRAC